jgi:anti-anti-sigma factor
MAGVAVDVGTSLDGSLVIQPHGDLGAEDAVDLRHTLVHVFRRLRPLRLVFDLRDVRDIDPINLGTLVAACHLGDDEKVAVFLDNSSTEVARRLSAAGVARHRIRQIRSDVAA